MNWLYQGKELTDTPADMAGFVYLITNTVTGKMYVGKKIFWSNRTLPPLKGKKRKRKVKKESDWRKYYGSCEPLLADLETLSDKAFTREIISMHENRTELNYAELCELLLRNTLDACNSQGEKIYYNSNIERRYYPSKVHGKKRTEAHNRRLGEQDAIQTRR